MTSKYIFVYFLATFFASEWRLGSSQVFTFPHNGYEVQLFDQDSLNVQLLKLDLSTGTTRLVGVGYGGLKLSDSLGQELESRDFTSASWTAPVSRTIQGSVSELYSIGTIRFGTYEMKVTVSSFSDSFTKTYGSRSLLVDKENLKITWEFISQSWPVGTSRVVVDTATLVSTSSPTETPSITSISDPNYETFLNLRLLGSSFEANYTAEKDAVVGGVNAAVTTTPIVTVGGNPGTNVLFAYINVSIPAGTNMLYDPNLDVVFGQFGSGSPSAKAAPSRSSAPLTTTAADEALGSSAIPIAVGISVGVVLLVSVVVVVVLLQRRRMSAESRRVQKAIRGAALS